MVTAKRRMKGRGNLIEGYVNLERAYDKMRFGWQETIVTEWQKGRMYGEKKRQRAWMETGNDDFCNVLPGESKNSGLCAK